MSLLMQALKKAEHAKQKQAGAPPEKDVGSRPDEALSLSPKEAPDEAVAMPEQTSDQGDFTQQADVELLMPDLSLSPRAEQASGEPTSVLPSTIEPARPEPREPDNFLAQQNAPPVVTTAAASAAADSRTTGNFGSTTAARTVRDETDAKNFARPPAPKHGAGQHEAAAQAEKKIITAQQQAKTVFAAKQPARKRRTFLIAGVGLAAFIMLAGAGYVYWQITGPAASSLIAATPPPLPAPAMQAQAPAPAVSALAAAPIGGMAGTEPPASSATATHEAGTGSSREPALAAATPGAISATPDKAAQGTPKTQTAAAAQGASANAIQIRQSVSGNQINPALQNAYQSFISGDTTAARQQYQKVLRQDPNNRDALLGLAAIALNQHQTAQAGALYVKLLELYPADPDAIAGLSGLQHGDPLQSESELKESLAQNPQSGAVLFALGNLYARQSRWAEAQQTYFRAFANAPENSDYAFNLAVSLDQLNQARLAQEYYRRALALAQSSPGSFNRGGAQIRIEELQAAADK